MQFALDEDRALLARSTRELLEKEAALATNRQIMESEPAGYSKALFKQLGELGYPSLLLTEEQGGLGAVAFAAVLHEMGRVALPGPFLDLALAIKALAGNASDAAKKCLAKASAGEALVVLARNESLTTGDVGAPTATFSSGSVKGVKRFVPFGLQADALIVETTGGLVLVPKPAAGWNAKPMPTIDHAQRFAEVTLDAPGTLLCEGPAACRAIGEIDALGALGASALLLGLMERALEITVAYTMERRAFGAPIAGFQALQHRAADMLLHYEQAKSMSYLAAMRCTSKDAAERRRALSAAKVLTGRAARFIGQQAVQLHGGMGMSDELVVSHWFKRLTAIEMLFGDSDTHLQTFIEASALS
jgi:alkylation response protein AidB-like acyl-CoA dehydrogenase